MKITIEADGYRLVIDDSDLESFSLQLPRDVQINPDGTKELFGRVGVTLIGEFKDDFRPQWEEVTDGDQ